MSDFSKTPLDHLLANLAKGYVGIHIQQGVPLLDRDLNLLQDLISATVRSVITHYIGNGISVGADGFAIQALPAPPPAQDFRILAGAGGPGSCLVGGIEVTIPADTTYKAQPGLPPLTTPTAAQPDPRTDLVYLDVFFTEVDSTVDADLSNSLDVGMPTAVRILPAWVVRVAEGVPVPAAGSGHTFYPLAQLLRPRGKAAIEASMITDLRQRKLNLAAMEQRLTLLERLVLVPGFAPSPNQFNPKIGTPGTPINLLGTNLNASTPVVRFGAIPAVLVGIPTATHVVVNVPTMPPGPVVITLETVGGIATAVDSFTVLPAPPPVPVPTMAASPNQFNPKIGASGTAVTINGTNFNQPPQTVRFGGVTATLAAVPTATQITANVPVMPPGVVTISVQTAGGTVTSVDSFTVIA